MSQSPGWVDALCRSGYEDATRVYAARSGARMVLPLVRRCGGGPRASGSARVDARCVGHGRTAHRGVPPQRTTFARSSTTWSSTGAVRITVRPNPLQAQLWDAAAHHARGSAYPAPGARARSGRRRRAWSGIHISRAPRARRCARRSVAGIEVRSGNAPELLCDFRRLYDLSVRRWAAGQNEPVALAQLRAHRRDAPAKWMRYRGRPARRHAALARLSGRRTDRGHHRAARRQRQLHARRDGQGRGRPGLRANELLHWLAIQHACAARLPEVPHGRDGRVGRARALQGEARRRSQSPTPSIASSGCRSRAPTR